MQKPCPHCQGSGKEEASEYTTQIINALKKRKQATCNQIHEDLEKVSRNGLTAVYQQMGRLHKLKVIQEVGDSRPKVWEMV